MANELLTRDDIIRGKKNFDAQNLYMTGTADEQVTLPDGQKIKTRAGFEKGIKDRFPPNTIGNLLSGTDRGNVPLAENTFKASTSFFDLTHPENNNTQTSVFTAGTRHLVYTKNNFGIPEGLLDDCLIMETIISGGSAALLQKAWGAQTGELYLRSFDITTSSWSGWRHSSSSIKTYTTTTATSANVVVTPTGELQRSTSSKIFKKDIADITIPDYRAALKSVRPVSYRSTEATADRTDWSWYSFIAEELAEIDPRLVQMDNVEFFEDTDEDGNPFINSRELPEGEYAANGINTNGLVALMAYISQQLLDDVEKLESEKTQLKRRMTSLEKRMDALDGQSAANPV